MCAVGFDGFGQSVKVEDSSGVGKDSLGGHSVYSFNARSVSCGRTGAVSNDRMPSGFALGTELRRFRFRFAWTPEVTAEVAPEGIVLSVQALSTVGAAADGDLAVPAPFTDTSPGSELTDCLEDFEEFDNDIAGSCSC
ncbi:hypothetical protein MRX96_031443 [Rhipicephalus microplus]